ncbi:hypothetical protein [Candidatus Entotheonella palauensis]|uniref:hypothetical protein n=1 Tax=Candidatus Entotheonella palauensis TaxID=93172 RepID=UPI001177CF90|nr:hypothetical protein [Candidatus Entotheonella palauensis]
MKKPQISCAYVTSAPCLRVSPLGRDDPRHGQVRRRLPLAHALGRGPDAGAAGRAAVGLGQLYPHGFLTEWAYWGGVKGIEMTRWLLGAGA